MFAISHEVPIQLLEESRNFNDYDYALVHLFKESSTYLDFFKESLKKGRRVILDNSAYELGQPFEEKLYKEAIMDLRPTEYILPDYRDDSGKNLAAIRTWNLECVDAKKIGVVHGENFEMFCANYLNILPYVDKVAISFESFFIEYADNRKISLAEARVSIIERMLTAGIIDTTKLHHILGALSPTEYQSYVEYDWIESADTSNPVLHGLLGIQYEGDQGLVEKSSVKLESLLHEEISHENYEIVIYNISWFRNQFPKRFKTIETTQPDFSKITSSLADLLKYKNGKYGNAALEPLNIFSGKSKVGQRLDDKLARVKNSKDLAKNDIVDLLGYLVLVCEENDWRDFSEFKD